MPGGVAGQAQQAQINAGRQQVASGEPGTNFLDWLHWWLNGPAPKPLNQYGHEINNPSFIGNPEQPPSPTPPQSIDPTTGQPVQTPTLFPGSTANVGNGFAVNNVAETQYLTKNYNYKIWTGQERYQASNRYGSGRVGEDTNIGTSIPVPTDAKDYMSWWQSSASPAEISALQTRLAQAGLMTPTKFLGSWDSATEDGLSKAMAQSALHPDDPSFTVDAYINQRIAYAQAHPNASNRTITSTDTTLHLTDPEAAKGLLESALSQYLGRLPTPAEVAQFTAALNSQERANPEVRTTKTNVSTDPNTGLEQTRSSSSTTTGGYQGQGQYAVDYARSQKGSAEFQTATTMMNALEAKLKGS